MLMMGGAMRHGFLIVFSVVLTACGGFSNSPTHPASSSSSTGPTPKLSDIDVVAQGMGWLRDYVGETSVGVVFRNTSRTYAYLVEYQATLYDAQGAQVGT